jgi:hypothetical protein
MNDDRRLDALMNDLENDQLLALEPIAMDTNRIKALTHGKLRAQTAHVRKTQRLVRPRFKMLIAACIVFGALIVGTAAYAIGSILLVGENPLSFSFNFDSVDMVDLPEGGVPIYGEQVSNLEQYNVAVGQRLETDGVAVTLDTVALDDNFVLVFLTYEFDEPVDLTAVVKPGYADVDALRMFTGQPTVSLDGLQLLGVGYEAKDSTAYFADAEQRVVKTATQYLIPTMLPNELNLSVTVKPTSNDRHVLVSAVPEHLNFSVALDKSAAAAQTRAIKPGVYDFTIEGQTWSLDLQKFAITPFGAVIVVNTHEDEQSSANYLGLWDFALVDQNGTTLQRFAPASAQQGAVHAALIRDLPSGLSALSINPPTSAPRREVAPYLLSDIGMQIPTDASNGLILREVRVSGSELITSFEPYGNKVPLSLNDPARYSGSPVGTDFYLPEVILNFDSLDPYLFLGSVDGGLDEATGLYVVTHRFYSANEEQIRQITSFHVPFAPGVITYDSTQTVSLALS